MDTVETIYLNIAGFNIQINFKSIEWEFAYRIKKNEINKYWKGFIISRPKKTDYTINFVGENHIKTINKIKERTQYILFYKKNSNKILTVNYLISIFHFQILLRQVINDLLSQHNGFILHASSNLVNNYATIFLAPSGGGKSTIMKLLSKKYQPLADDTVFIRKEFNKYYLYQTPFIEKESWIIKNNNKYLLNKIYLLNKSSKYLITKIVDNETKIDKIFQQFWTDKNSYSKQTRTIIRLILNNNFYNIFFGVNSDKLITLLNKYD